MTQAQVKASLKLWHSRLTYRQKKVDYYRGKAKSGAGAAKAGVVTADEAHLIKKWEHLRDEAKSMIARREKQLSSGTDVSAKRKAIVAAAERAAANYRKRPGSYHYLAGGVANTTIMEPTPRNYRSDCSQFAVNVYRHAGVPCPGSGTYLYSNTDSIDNGGRVTSRPKPGDLGMYGRHGGYTHHVEVYVGNGRFIGHGTAPIDSVTPGRPNYYLNFLGD